MIGAALVNERLRLRQQQFRRAVFRAVDIAVSALNIKPLDRQLIALRGASDTRLETVPLAVCERQGIILEILDFMQRDRIVVDFPFGLEFVCDILQCSIDVGVIELDRLLRRIEAFADFPNSGPVALVEIPDDSFDEFVGLGAHRPFEAFIDGITHLIQAHVVLQCSEGERVFDIAGSVFLDVFRRSEFVFHALILAPCPDRNFDKFR